jgi:hypothetical protein
VDEGFLESVVHARAPLLARLNPVATRLWRVPVSGHVVLGRRLRPFSLWHQQLLQGVNSPFLTVWKEQPTSLQLFQNLFIATQICRLKPFETPKSEGFRAVVRRKLSVLRFYVCAGRGQRVETKRLLSLLIEAAKFRAYVADYSSGPIPFPTRHGRPVQTPVAVYQIELYRRFHSGLSLKTVWGMSPGEVAWANTSAREANDQQIEIMTEARLEARKIAMEGGKKKKPLEAGVSPAKPNGNGHARR